MTTTWTNLTKHLALAFLLKEDGFFLLLETGDKIILEQSNAWTNQTKN